MKTLQIAAALILGVCSSQTLAAPAVSVALVLDESGSISSSNFQLQTNGFIEAVKRIPADGSVEASVIGFASSVQVIRNKVLVDPAGSTNLQNALATNPQSNGSTNMSGAINTATTVLSTSVAPTRIICLATDGAPDNQSATVAAANAARAAGVIVAPIGVGLGASGKTFLDAIADPSRSPVPNPTTFEEFAAIVQNACIGIVESALRISLSPDPLDFGNVDPKDGSVCGGEKRIRLANESNRAAQIENVFIRGVADQDDDSKQFQLLRLADQPASGSDAFQIPPLYSISIDIAINPNTMLPDDSSYDAELVVEALDTSGDLPRIVEFTARLVAPVIEGPCLDVGLTDALGLIERIDGDVPKQRTGQVVDEFAVKAHSFKPGQARSGLVADGNARVFVIATVGTESGIVRFTISSPSDTQARLHRLDHSPNDSGETSIDVPITAMNGKGQASVILRAGERFLGSTSQPRSQFSVNACLLTLEGNCSNIKTHQIEERRAAVILIHGLWADENSWTSKKWLVLKGDDGVAPTLRSNHFYVGYHNYDNGKGPTQEMTSRSTGLADAILSDSSGNILNGKGMCNEMMKNYGLACTRADIVGHSMGGLMARKFFYEDNLSKTAGNFHQGAVRRLVTLGTPYEGSPFASWLQSDDGAVNNCIIDMLPVDGVQNFFVDNIRGTLDIAGKSVTKGAIADLAIGSPLLQSLRSGNGRTSVSTFAVQGDIGTAAIDTGIWIANRVFGANLFSSGCSASDLFGTSTTDGIVAAESATFSVGGLKNTATARASNAAHVGMGARQAIADIVLLILNGDLSVFDRYAFPTRTSSVNKNDMPQASVSKAALSHKKPRKESVKDLIGGALMALSGIRDAHAQVVAPSIALTVNRTVASPGDTLIFTADVVGHPGTALTLMDGESFALERDAAPYQWTLPLGKAASGELSVFVQALVDDEIVISNQVSVLVLANSADLRQILFDPGTPRNMGVGDTEQLRLIGRYRDGYDRDLTEAVTGTKYSENVVDGLSVTPGDSPVIKVSSEGLVTALAPGEADVVATNNGFFTVRRIRVSEILSFAAPPDTDNDGIPDDIEDGVPNPNGPGFGDGNSDGIPDSEQAHVASFLSQTQDNTYLTLAIPPGLMLVAVQSVDLPDDLPRGVVFPYGGFSFVIEGLDTAGASVKVNLFTPNGIKLDGYWKKDADGRWLNIAPLIRKVGNKLRIDFVLVDGGSLDTDRVKDKRIIDPGFPGYFQTGSPGPTPIPAIGHWGLALLGVLMLLVIWRSKQRPRRWL